MTVAKRQPLTDEALKAHVREHITRFKVPRQIFCLPSLPKGATNKIRRDQVAALCRSRMLAEELRVPQASSRSGSPSSAVEEEIAQAWCRVLGVVAVLPRPRQWGMPPPLMSSVVPVT